MLFWIMIGLIFVALGIFFVASATKSYDPFCPIIGIIVSFFLAIIIIGSTIGDYVGYVKLKNKIDIRREQYETLIKVENKNEVYKIVDIMGINEELAEYQTDKKSFGYFCVYPKEVFEIKPIGIE